jgi:alkaline phosphatase D
LHPNLDRRGFLVTAATAAIGAATSDTWAAAEQPPPGGRLPDGLFSLGVASGDPLPDAVVLWTRLAPEPLAPDGSGGMPARRVPVQWEVAHDESFRRVVRRGTAHALPERAHSVHVDVRGLEPDRWYSYRFRVGRETSPTARTRTTPAPGATGVRLAFAFASCQNFTNGYYTAYQDMVASDLDMVVHLGDYIYEGPGRGAELGRAHAPAGETVTLADYRVRHAQYKGDADLQRAHAVAPWVVTLDDHEVKNNWTGEGHPAVPPEEFRARRAAAFQALFEHMPLRRAQAPVAHDMQLYRALDYGNLARFHVLDTRQYRSALVSCDDADCAAAFDPARTMLGADQEAWLDRGLRDANTSWNVLAQQVPVYEDAPVGLPADKWDGYRVSRQRLLDSLATSGADNPVAITGDVHFNSAADLLADFADPASPVLGSEFVGTSIASSSPNEPAPETVFDPDPANPHLKFTNRGERGYVRCTVDEGRWRSEYRVVDTVDRPTSPARTVAAFEIEAGRAGMHRTT